MWSLKKSKTEAFVQTVQQQKTEFANLVRNEEGYFTVEASFLVPMLCFLTLGVLFVSLYLCDVNIGKSFLQEQVTAWALNGKQGIYNGMADNKELEKRLLVAKVEEFGVVKKGRIIEGKLIMKMEPQVPFFGTWIGKVWRNTLTFKKEMVYSAEDLRRWD